jgi:hypothetical protein
MSHESTEKDLWALDDLEDFEISQDSAPAAADKGAVPDRRPAEPPSPRSNVQFGKVPAVEEDAISLKLKREGAAAKRSGMFARKNQRALSADDLPDWEDDLAKESTKTSEDIAAIAEISSAVAAKTQPAKASAPFSTALWASLKLSRLEKIGLISLFGLLLAAAAVWATISLKGLPATIEKAKLKDFPIIGKHLQITSAETFWRVPIADGKGRDFFRRGTVLLPVVKLSIGKQASGVRLIFRNSEGDLVGDVVTRAVDAGQTVEISATAGFDDMGMHAAYQTCSEKPWTIEVYEAATANAAASDFKKLFELNISTALH